MQPRTCMLSAFTLSTAMVFGIASGAEPDKEAQIREVLIAAPPAVATTAKVVTMDNKVLKEGSGPYTCSPTPPDELAKGGKTPMCLDIKARSIQTRQTNQT